VPDHRGRELVAAAAAHLALAAVFFAPALLTGRILVPGDTLHAIYPWGAYLPQRPSHNAEPLDAVQQFYPWFVVFRERILSGQLPLWNPDSALGVPHAANELTACWFPLSLLALLPLTLGWNLLLVARLVLAGSGAFFLLRELGVRRLSSALGSVAWAYSLPFVLFLPMSIANVNALLPWLVVAAVRLGRRPGPRRAAAFGAALALVHLGGQPEAALFGALTAALFGVLAAGSRAVRSAGWLLAGGVAGTVAAGIQLLPFLDYLSRSRALLEAGARSHPFPPSRLVTWVVPLFFGGPLDGSGWAETPLIDHGGFAGAVLLGAAGLAIAAKRRRRLIAPLVVVVSVVLLCYVLPPLPVLGKVRMLRLLPLAAFGIVVLGAFGLDRLAALGRKRAAGPAALAMGWPLVAALAVLFAVKAPPLALGRTAIPGLLRATVVVAAASALLAIRHVGRRVRTAGLCAVVLLDLWPASFDYLASSKREDLFFETGVTRFLRAQPEAYRLLPLGYTMPPATNLPQKIPSILSYDALDDFAQSRFLRRMGGFYEALFSTVDPDAVRNPRVLELANVRYLLDDPLGRRRDTPAERARSGLDLGLVYDAPDGRLYELKTARPRAWAAGFAEIDPGFHRFWPRLEAGDPASTSVPWVDASEAPAGGGGPASVRIVSRTPGTMRLAASAATAAWLVVAEGYDPGWRAAVDGAAAPVYRANGAFCAVPIPAGSRDVVLTYLPRSLQAGASLSVLGVLILAAGFRAGDRRASPQS
jgi:hypothetical protein